MFYKKLKRRAKIWALLTICTLPLAGGLVFAQTVTQGYNSDDNLQRGMLVMLKADDSSKVTALTPEKVDKMLGVVVSPSESVVTISSKNQKVFVASSGRYDVLVSDENGPIKTGDYVTVSSVAGIGMKAGDTQVSVLGQALENFNGKDNLVGTIKAKDANNQDKQVNLGRVKVDINITRNPWLKAEANVPELLKKASNVVAQKDVGANRIYLAVVALILTSIVAGIVLYAGVRSAIIALGRNPFSKKTIFRGLIQVILTSMIIFLCGLFGVYLLLKL